MSTPMRHALSQLPAAAAPSAAAATPPTGGGGGGSTPLGRSSPQTIRRGSPATTATVVGSDSNKVGGAVSFDSPSAAAALGALGLADIGNIDAIVAGLGPARFRTDDDFAKKLDGILDILGKKKGMVSEEGLERLAKKLGFECMWEDTQQPAGRRTRTLVIAGRALQLDIALDGHVVVAAWISFPLSSPLLTKHTGSASAILLQDLQLAPGQSPLTKCLDQFAANLDRLAGLDRLSVIPGLDCHEAPAGICESLDRLYRWDLARIGRDRRWAGQRARVLRRVVMCTRHGCPEMNARRKVGLSLQYWMARWSVPPSREADDDWVDRRSDVWSLLIGCAPMPDVAGMICPPVRVSTGWISDAVQKGEDGEGELDWLEPEPTVLPAGGDSAGGSGGGAGSGMLPTITDRYPNVMFQALLDPAVVVPHGVMMLVDAAASMQQPVVFPWPTYDELVFAAPRAAAAAGGGHVQANSEDPPSLFFSRTIQIKKDYIRPGTDPAESEWVAVREESRLSMGGSVYAHRLTELPFSHPRQLVELLPTLRQYAFLGILLKNTFGAGGGGGPAKTAAQTRRAREGQQGPQGRGGQPPTGTAELATKTTSEELNRIISEPETTGSTATTDGDGGREAAPADVTAVTATARISAAAAAAAPPSASQARSGRSFDATLTMHPVPRIHVVFPMASSRVPASVVFEIRENGVAHILDQNILPDPATGRAGIAAGWSRGSVVWTVDRLGRKLVAFEDIGLWCAWIKSRLGGEDGLAGSM